LLEELASELRPRCQERGIALETALGASTTEVLADRTQLLVALRAIGDNALEALEPGGRIAISCRAQESRQQRTALIEISDNGRGFDEQVRRHLFDPFFSGRISGRGLGMGLAKCWRIVQMHQGAIAVTSTPKERTTFSIALPLHDPPSAPRRSTHRRNGST
jgi:signal transduction histidine kinase